VVPISTSVEARFYFLHMICGRPADERPLEGVPSRVAGVQATALSLH
jgi:hypothetical protein